MKCLVMLTDLCKLCSLTDLRLITMQTSNRDKVKSPQRAIDARSSHSNTFLVTHVAYAAVIVFLAGAVILLELARFTPEKPLYEQGMILLPYLAALGWGVDAGGQVVHTFPYFVVGVFNLVSAGILAAGAYFHSTKVPPSLADTAAPASNYHATWDNPKKLGRILGTHLIFWGIGAALFVAKAVIFGGLYDATIGDVRLVTDPTLDFGAIASYRTRLFSVDNLEDLVGGHLYIAAILIAGGIWHILVEPREWVKERFLFNGNGILSYTLFGVSLGSFAASYFCGFNDLAYPVEFYGPTLELKSALLPHYLDPNAASATSRTLLANAFFYVAFLFFVGSFWHLGRATGFDFSTVRETWKRAAAEANPYPVLPYQKQFSYQPQGDPSICYEPSRVEVKPAFTYQKPATNYTYHASKIANNSEVTNHQGAKNTLYEVTYHPKRSIFYHSPSAEKKMAGDRKPLTANYEQPRVNKGKSAYAKPSPTTFYAGKPG